MELTAHENHEKIEKHQSWIFRKRSKAECHKNQDEKVLMVIPCYRLEKAPKLSSSEKHVLSDSHLVTFLVGTMNTGHASGYNERSGWSLCAECWESPRWHLATNFKKRFQTMQILSTFLGVTRNLMFNIHKPFAEVSFDMRNCFTALCGSIDCHRPERRWGLPCPISPDVLVTKPR